MEYPLSVQNRLRSIALRPARVTALAIVALLVMSCSQNAPAARDSDIAALPAPPTQATGVDPGRSPQTQQAATHTSHPDEPVSGPYAAEIAEAATKASTQFQRDILNDGVITRSEYLEAVNRYVSCMDDNGLKVLLSDRNGLFSMAVASDHRLTQEDDAAEFACAAGSIMHITDLYERLITDPDQRGFPNQVYDCAKSLGLIPPGYTENDYLEDKYRNAVVVEMGPDGPINVPTTDVAPASFPFDNDDPRYIACQMNPVNPPITAPPTR